MWHDLTKQTNFMSDDQKSFYELIVQEKNLAMDYLHFIRKFDQKNKGCYNGVQISIDQWNQNHRNEIKWEIKYIAVREEGVNVFLGGYETEETHYLSRKKDQSAVSIGTYEDILEYIRNELNGLSETEWEKEYTWETEEIDKYETWVNELGLDVICLSL